MVCEMFEVCVELTCFKGTVSSGLVMDVVESVVGDIQGTTFEPQSLRGLSSYHFQVSNFPQVQPSRVNKCSSLSSS